MTREKFIKLKKDTYIRQGFDERSADMMSEGDWRRFNIEKITHANTK